MWVQVEHKSLFQSQFFTKNLQVPNLKIQKQLIKYVSKTLIIEVKSSTTKLWNVVGAERTSTTPNRIVI
jgi:hypothetical protein